MKKVMLGILVMIPIIVLLIVALVTTFLSVQAWVAVDDMSLNFKGSGEEAEDLVLGFEDAVNGDRSFYDYLDVQVMPEKANRYTVEWYISGDIQYQDIDYKSKYDYYINNKSLNYDDDPENDIDVVYPAVMLVDGEGREVSVNSTGKFRINSYCSFTLVVQAENVTRNIDVSIVGFDVEKISLSAAGGKDTLRIGETMRLLAQFTPIDSIVTNAEWRSSDESALSVDGNGVVTAKAETDGVTVTMSTYNGFGDRIEGSFTVKVEGGASSKFGDKLVTSRETLDFDEIGISENEVEEFVGCSSNGGKITVNEDEAAIKLKSGDVLSVRKCLESDIVIENAEQFKLDSGYILAVGEMNLKLRAKYADALRSERPESVEWRSSDESIATVSGGSVKANASGVVRITAIVDDASTEIELNIQNKVTSMRLRTNDASMIVGLAKETVFASDKFANSDIDSSVEPNSVLIQVAGEPKRTASMTDGEYDALLRAFYSAYDFEVASEGGYAHFDTDIVNKLIFDSANLEGNGKREILVKVSAKYPKYEGNKQFTEATVTIKAVFGVQVNNMKELRMACQLQKDYALREDNVVPEETIFTSAPAPKDGKIYTVTVAQKSHRRYAVALGGNCSYYDGEECVKETQPVLFGDLYGNGHIIFATGEQVGRGDNYWRYALVHIGWSDCVMSNVTLRPHQLPDDGVITDGEDTLGFTGTALGVWIYNSESGTSVPNVKRLENVKVEYSILENAHTGIRTDDASITLDGCILRNMRTLGILGYQKIENSGDLNVVRYDEYTLNNVICSNSLGTMLGYTFQHFTKYGTGDKANRFADNDEENLKWVEENIINATDSRGHVINGGVHQTGFLDIYNWLPVSSANIIDTGDKEWNNRISTLAAPLIENNSAFRDTKYVYNDETYFHMGMFCSGIETGIQVFNEKTFLNFEFEDERFYSIYSKDIERENNGGDLGAVLVKAIEIRLFGYKNTSSLTPASSYTVNAELIEKLHGNY